MMEALTEFVLAESRWLAMAMVVASATVGLWAWRRGEGSGRERTLRLMNLFYGCVIAVMGTGHLLAVTISLAQGTLQGAPWLLYAIGILLVVPAAILARRAVRDPEHPRSRAALWLNGFLGLFLLVNGTATLPLAVPTVLNIGFQLHSRRSVGWTLGALALAVYAFLLVGSLVFMASGQTFEQFTASP